MSIFFVNETVLLKYCGTGKYWTATQNKCITQIIDSVYSWTVNFTVESSHSLFFQQRIYGQCFHHVENSHSIYMKLTHWYPVSKTPRKSVMNLQKYTAKMSRGTPPHWQKCEPDFFTTETFHRRTLSICRTLLRSFDSF